MKSCLFLLLMVMLGCTCFGGETPLNRSDTTPRKMRPVDITATYEQGRKQASFAPLSILTGAHLSELGAWQVSDALVQLPSAYIKNYGGLNALKTVSLRATTSQQTLVLLDGIRIASSASGTVDLSAIPLVFFDDIELAGGGASALYGGGAMAGVVNLRTRPTSRTLAKVALAGGSFGDALLSAAGNATSLGVQWNIGGEFMRSDGRYSFPVTEFGTEKTLYRTNSDFRNLGLTLSGQFDASAWKINNRLFVRTSERGAPGAVLQGVVEQIAARLGEDDILFVHSSSRKILDNSQLKLAGSARYSNLRYRDKDALFRGPNGADDLYITREAMLSANVDTYAAEYATNFRLEWTFADLRGNTFQPGVGNQVRRATLSASGALEKEWHLDSSLHLSTQLQARYDVNSSADNAFSPLLAVMLHKDDCPVRLRSSWSYNFRLPSFNELYYFNFGTANLRPERAHSLNIGGLWQPNAILTAEVNGFIILTKDQILAVPKSPISWSAQNIGSVLSRGIEVSAGGQLFDTTLSVRLSYTRQTATDETAGSLTFEKVVPTIPQELFSAAIAYHHRQLTVGGTANYSSFRYGTADNSTESLLPGYLQVNVFSEVNLTTFGAESALRVECNNLFNALYAVIINYPMPARSFRIGLRMKFNSKE